MQGLSCSRPEQSQVSLAVLIPPGTDPGGCCNVLALGHLPGVVWCAQQQAEVRLLHNTALEKSAKQKGT